MERARLGHLCREGKSTPIGAVPSVLQWQNNSRGAHKWSKVAPQAIWRLILVWRRCHVGSISHSSRTRTLPANCGWWNPRSIGSSWRPPDHACVCMEPSTWSGTGGWCSQHRTGRPAQRRFHIALPLHEQIDSDIFVVCKLLERRTGQGTRDSHWHDPPSITELHIFNHARVQCDAPPAQRAGRNHAFMQFTIAPGTIQHILSAGESTMQRVRATVSGASRFSRAT